MMSARPIRIAYVEDTAHHAEAFLHTCRHFQEQIHVVASGEELIEKWDEITPEIIFVDLTIVGSDPKRAIMQGVDIIKKVRERTKNAKFPAIVVTGSGEEEAKLHTRLAGADSYATKPIVLDRLLDSLRQAGFKFTVVHDDFVVASE